MSHPFEKCKDGESKERMSLCKIEPAARMIEGKQALRSTSGLFAYGHFQLRNIDPDFCFAFGAVQWKVVNYSIFENFCSGFVATDGA